MLTSGSWLTANHISAANQLMRSQFHLQNGLQDTCALSQKLRWQSQPTDFVQILFVSNGHWACLSHRFSSDGTIDLHDSMHTIPTSDGSIAEQACLIMYSAESTLTINVTNADCQKGCDDCGLFTIAMAYDLCCGVDPLTRDHLNRCFEARNLETFPSEERIVSQRVVYEMALELHCICRRPILGIAIVCCNVCDTWYHKGCIPIPTEVLEDEDDSIPWECIKCKAGTVINISEKCCMLLHMLCVCF